MHMQISYEWVVRAMGIGLVAALILKMCAKPLAAYLQNPRHRWLKGTMGAVLFVTTVFCAAFITDKVPEHTEQSVAHYLFAYFICAPIGLLGALMVYGATTPSKQKTISG